MTDLTLHTPQPLALPQPRVPISTRVATMEDMTWIDQLQKQHGKALGFFPRAQMQGYIERGWVLVAEATKDEGEGSGLPLGYVAYRDRYLKRDELGAVFQLCVRKELQRGYIGAALLKAAFERSAYGCRLFCCWCAQDLAANHFWEAMGFVPLAFRTGSKTRGSRKRGSTRARVHIFWQKRIREGDVTTPWWFPSETGGGAVREDRIVLPIPPGVHWSEVQPVEVGLGTEDSGLSERAGEGSSSCSTTALVLSCKASATERETATPAAQSASGHRKPAITLGGLRFESPAPAPAPVAAEKPRRRRVKVKNDPTVAAAARELRDRWVEQINRDYGHLAGTGKYDLARTLPAPGAAVRGMLPAA